ncbi:MAG: efflux transporter periplasmic adaptor subunit [Cytophagales bacterium CG12_big_fil_rev_8_21_14_0_65_40_12]|nr:MAG: efflux transporter periplasmic adaptor subunit [Cytophagales bacterium CG12_big_fil_rev_8_21_14_0_65_40_12]PIW04761.1 MAG: efflux RND transporter periplasmic adaptor subunit [Cytophagales bacterium CG17_big_fil_post_rev_8_21_14_2_50_40_13]
MKIDKSTILTIVITLIVGVALGSFLFNGKDNESLTTHEHEVSAVTGLWTCSMHPQVQASEPGACPFCGMDLIPLAGDEAGGNPQALKMSAAAMQLANIQTTIVGEGTSNANLVLNGRVKADTRQTNVQTTHFAARIEKLYKNFEGESIRKGDKIASLYSPQLVTAQEELIEAKKMEASNPVLLEAARKKLHHWKLTMEQIQEIETSSKPMRNFNLLSDYDGVISKKMVNAGDHLKEGGVLLEVTDLSKVWAVFEVYEKDLQYLKVGQQIDFSASSNSDQVFDGKIAFIEPILNVNKRIIEVRVDVDNRNGLLKPDMFLKGSVSLAESKKGIAVPKSAVLWTGERSIVYLKTIDESGTYFQLREVKLGANSGEAYEILEGLTIGDEVVTNGAFTLDAEAQLKGKVSMMNPSGGKTSTGHDHGSMGMNVEDPFEVIDLPKAQDFTKTTDPSFKNQLNQLTKSYIRLKDEMVKGQALAIQKAGKEVASSLAKVDMKLTKGEAHMHWMALLTPMQTSLNKIISNNERDMQRLEFINLSKAFINAVQSFGVEHESPLYVQFCPMANDNKGATWISLNENIINPYFGDVMLTCGSVESVIGQ